MIVIVFAMLVTLALAAGVAGLVVMGLQGRGRRRAPELFSRFTRLAQPFRDGAEPPESLQRLVDRHLVGTREHTR